MLVDMQLVRLADRFANCKGNGRSGENSSNKVPVDHTVLGDTVVSEFDQRWKTRSPVYFHPRSWTLRGTIRVRVSGR